MKKLTVYEIVNFTEEELEKQLTEKDLKLVEKMELTIREAIERYQEGALALLRNVTDEEEQKEIEYINIHKYIELLYELYLDYIVDLEEEK